jgi:hypothetical protein
MHRFIGQDTSNYLCLYKMLGKSCPICAAAKEAKDAGEEDESKALSYAKLCCVWLLDRDDDQKEHPILYPMGWMMDRDIAILCSNKKTGNVLLIDHPTEGYDVVIRRTGTSLNTRYLPQIEREMSNIDEDSEAQDRILEYITENPIPETLRFYDADYLSKVISGTSVEKDKELDQEDVDEDEEEAPRKRTATAARSRKPVVEEDEEEEEVKPVRRKAAVVEEDEEEEEAKPVRRKAAVVEDDEEEEEEEAKPVRRKAAVVEDDEEEAKPARRATRRPVVEEADEEEEATPSARSGPPRKAAVVEEEDEEIVEEEDEEEPAPRRPTRR